MTKAPKTMATIFRPSLKPFHRRASSTTTFSWKVRPVMLKYVNASSIVHTSARGATFMAGFLNARMPTSTNAMGLIANTKLMNPIM